MQEFLSTALHRANRYLPQVYISNNTHTIKGEEKARENVRSDSEAVYHTARGAERT